MSNSYKTYTYNSSGGDNIKNEPLLFINTPNYIENDTNHNVFDSRKKIEETKLFPYEKRVSELVKIYENHILVLVEITTKEKVFSGYITGIKGEMVIIHKKGNDEHINVKDIININIIKV